MKKDDIKFINTWCVHGMYHQAGSAKEFNDLHKRLKSIISELKSKL